FATSVGDERLEVLIPDRTHADSPPDHHGGIPILWPFPNRVAGARYRWAGNEYAMTPNERGTRNHIHGLVRDLPWKVDAQTASTDGAVLRASIELADFPEAFRQYPFPARLTVDFELRDGELEHRATVTNLGEAPLPTGYGTHPWFPSHLRGPSSETSVRIEAERAWTLDRLVATGETVPVTGRLDFRGGRPLGTDSYDDVVTKIKPRHDGWSEAVISYPSDRLEIVLEASSAYREWVVYHPAGGEVLCVEPYSCTTNAINLVSAGIDAGLSVVPPGGAWQGTFRLSARATTPRQG
ncbi:MAG TPA: aldose 1-epimerase, partial [Candidatus Limnocylindrales bacterium]|nr:aldose 1-epimerase [Candidatus Limnocylindrales bacterium]